MRIATLTLIPLLAGCIVGDTPDTITDPADCAGADPVEWDEPVIDGETTFSCTTRFSGDLAVTGHLVLEPCAVLELGGSSRISVRDGGLLEAVGTEDCPVTITSSSSNPVAGDWQYIDIEDDADGATRFEHAVVEYGGDGEGAIIGGGVFDLVDVTVRHTPSDALSLDVGRVAALIDLVVEEVGGHPVVVDIADVAMIEGIEATVGIGEPSILVHSGDPLEVDTAWDAESLPYELDGSYNVRADLVVEEGTTLWMAPDTRVLVQSGRMDLIGTQTAPVVVESAAEVPLPGDWQQITYKADSSGSLWSWATVRHGGSDGKGAVRVEEDGRLALEHVTFEDNLDCDVDRTPPTPVDVPATDSPYVDCP